jgi:hypothetical protein
MMMKQKEQQEGKAGEKGNVHSISTIVIKQHNQNSSLVMVAFLHKIIRLDATTIP